MSPFSYMVHERSPKSITNLDMSPISHMDHKMPFTQNKGRKSVLLMWVLVSGSKRTKESSVRAALLIH